MFLHLLSIACFLAIGLGATSPDNCYPHFDALNPVKYVVAADMFRKKNVSYGIGLKKFKNVIIFRYICNRPVLPIVNASLQFETTDGRIVETVPISQHFDNLTGMVDFNLRFNAIGNAIIKFIVCINTVELCGSTIKPSCPARVCSTRTVVVSVVRPKGIQSGLEPDGSPFSSKRVKPLPFKFSDSTKLTPDPFVSPTPSSSPPAPSPTPSPRPQRESACFPARSLVSLADSRVVPMRSIFRGEQLLGRPGQNTTVYMFSHYDENIMADFITVEYEGRKANGTLTASHGHLVRTRNGLTVMQELRAGDILFDKDEQPLKIKNIREVSALGLYNPQTLDGFLVVDGVSVSSFTNAVTPKVAEVSLSPMRTLFRMGLVRIVELVESSLFCIWG